MAKFFCILLLTLTAPLLAQPTTNSVPSDTKALGTKFQSLAAGFAFCPPAEMKPFKGQLGTDEVARYTNDDRHWILKVTRLLQNVRTPLDKWTDPKDPNQVQHNGMLQFAIEQLKADSPQIEIVRGEGDGSIINVGPHPVGMIAARYNFATETNLTQEAVVQANEKDYFIIAMTCPAPKRGELDEDIGVKYAVDAFGASVDSVQILDQSMIEQDNIARLDRTRALLVNWTENKIRNSIVKEQWLRVIKDGKDIGYTYITQDIARDIPRKGKPERQTGPEGLLVGQRSRTITDKGLQIDSETWSFCSFDRRYEDWSTVAVSQNQAGKMLEQAGEIGLTRFRSHPVVVERGIGAKANTTLADEYRLEVTKLGRNVSPEPVAKELPPFYLPMSLEKALVQILPPHEVKTYLFASWVDDKGQLMYRYVDVGFEQEAKLYGQTIRAVPIKSRVGLEGPVTTSYLSPGGQFLGSENEATGLTILPSDPATLEKLWKGANLTRPGAVEDTK